MKSERSTRRWFEDWRTGVLLFSSMATVMLLVGYLRYQLADRFLVWIPPYWPLNIYAPVLLTWPEVGVAIAVLIGALVVFQFGWKTLSHSTLAVAGFGFGLAVFTNSLHGLKEGINHPIDGVVGGIGVQYYHDIPYIGHGILDFLRHYTDIQPLLHMHSQTHPPGPVIIIQLLLRLYHHIWFVSLSLSILAFAISAICLFGLLKRYVSAVTARYCTLIYLVIPAIQIYYLTTVDALICALLIGVVYAVTGRPTWWRFGLGGLALFAASALSFLSAFILPVIAGYALVKKQNRLYTAGLITVVLLGWAAVDWLTSYNYIVSFLIAQAVEGENAVKALSGYVATRLDSLAEIGLFFGPVLTTLLVQGLRKRQLTDLKLLCWLAISTYACMLAVGVFHNGETGRAALFIFPFLVLGLSELLDSWSLTKRQHLILFGLVFGQAVVMQLVGDYFW